MNNKIIILGFTLVVFLISSSVSVFALSVADSGAATVDPLSTTSPSTSTATPSSSSSDYLSVSRQGIGASTTHGTISASPQHILRGVDVENSGWGDPFLPGGNGWTDESNTGNVGYPMGDASGPMLLLMVLIYFIYRGVSATKRRNNI